MELFLLRKLGIDPGFKKRQRETYGSKLHYHLAIFNKKNRNKLFLLVNCSSLAV